MNWFDVLWLALGLGLGIGSSRWWMSRNQGGDRPVPSPLSPASLIPSPSPSPSPSLPASDLQQQLQQTQLAYQLAAEMQQFKAGFLARTSHELRSPLNSVISLHQLILSDLCDDPAEERDFVAQAHGSALKMLALLDQLINVAKVEHGAMPLQLQPVQLAKILESVQQLTYLQAQNRNLRLEMSIPDPDLYVLADANCLIQVLVNAVDTAIRLMDEGYIRLYTYPDPANAQVYLQIDDQRPASAWSEPIDCLQQPPSAVPDNALLTDSVADLPPQIGASQPLPAGLGMLANETLMEHMQGQITLLATSAAGVAAATNSGAEVIPTGAIAPLPDGVTRVQYRLRLIVPDTE